MKLKSMKLNCLVAALSLVCLLPFSGCETQSQTATPGNTTPVVNLSLNDVQKTNLAAADKLDGKEDHVVERCYSCALGMDGHAEHAAKVGEYELHFCSEGCVDNFVGSPGDVLTGTQVPTE